MSEQQDSFLAKAMPVPEAGCFIWMGALSRGGYGHVRYRGRPRGAHRVAYELFKGPFDQSLDVLHHCDTPCCVNPDHLFLGTHTDNMRDMRRKGRGLPSRQAAASHCKHGHEFSEKNTRIVRGARVCAKCSTRLRRESYVRHIEKRRAAARDYQRRKRKQT